MNPFTVGEAEEAGSAVAEINCGMQDEWKKDGQKGRSNLQRDSET